MLGDALREKIVAVDGFVLCLTVAAQHVHMLAKLPASAMPRHWMVLARKNATFAAHARGWQGNVWAKRGKEILIRDRRHQLAVYRYILRHASQGAWVWDWMHARE